MELLTAYNIHVSPVCNNKLPSITILYTFTTTEFSKKLNQYTVQDSKKNSCFLPNDMDISQ